MLGSVSLDLYSTAVVPVLSLDHVGREVLGDARCVLRVGLAGWEEGASRMSVALDVGIPTKLWNL